MPPSQNEEGLKTPPASVDREDSSLGVPRWISWILLLGAVGSILFLRAPETILSPALLFDDGQKVFAYFYEHRSAAEILRFRSGYIPLIGNLIGYLSVRLPTRWIPYGLAGSAFLISVATYSFFFARPFRRWVPSDLNRALTCLLFALAPVSDCFLLTVADYSLWNLLVLLILLTAIPPPEKLPWKYLHIALCNLLVWSHPLSFIILPVVVWFALRKREHRLFYRVLIFNLVVHQIFGVAGIVTTRGLWLTQGSVSVVHKFLLSSWWTIQLVPSIAFRTAFGEPVFKEAIKLFPVLFFVWAGILAVGVCHVFRRLGRVRPLLLYLTYLIVAVTFLSCLLRYQRVHDDPFAFIIFSPRYIYVQSLSFLLIYAILISALFQLRVAAAQARPQQARVRRLDSRWLNLPLTLLLVHYFYLNTQFGYFVRNASRTGPYHTAEPGNGLIVRRFFAQLAELEARQGSREGIHLEAPKRNDWPIVIDTTRPRRTTAIRFIHRAQVPAFLLIFVVLAYATREVWLGRLLSLARLAKAGLQRKGIPH